MRIAAALAVVLLLAGCGAHTTAGTPPPTSAPAAAVDGKRAVYLEEMRRVLPGRPDEALITVGRSLCDAFRDGASWVAAVQHLTDAGLSGYRAGEVIGSAVWAFCPQYRPRLPH